MAALIFPLVFRRRAPMTVFLSIAAVAFVQWLVTAPALADVSLLVALYTVALESEWVLVVAASVILEAGVVMATVRWTPTGNDVKSFVFLTGLAFTALLAGIVVRALRSQLDWLAERAERLELERDQQASLAAATERARIAREMHDVVSHNIQVMVTLADAASRRAGLGPFSCGGGDAGGLEHGAPGADRHAPHARRAAGGAGGWRRERGGRPSFAPQPGLGDLDALVERVRGTGLAVSVERSGRPFEVTGAAGLTVYRIVQEALTNALKHAEALGTVEVCLAFDDPDISVRVDRRRPHEGRRCPGRATATATAGPCGRSAAVTGVAGMAERAAAFGGTLDAGPRAAGGWEVMATLRDCKAPRPPHDDPDRPGRRPGAAAQGVPHDPRGRRRTWRSSARPPTVPMRCAWSSCTGPTSCSWTCACPSSTGSRPRGPSPPPPRATRPGS